MIPFIKFYLNFYYNFKGKEAAHEFNDITYMECSSRKGEGINEVFDKAVNLALTPKHNTRIVKGKQKRKRCIIF